MPAAPSPRGGGAAGQAVPGAAHRDLARTARARLASTLSPNARLQQLFHPWTSYVIVPLFALANTGIALDPSFLAHAYASR